MNRLNHHRAASASTSKLYYYSQHQSWLLTLTVLALLLNGSNGGFGIPGTKETENGYDTEMGTEAMCWRSTTGDNTTAIADFPNPLVKTFKIGGPIQLLTSCPNNDTLYGEAPIEITRDGERLRTKQWYNYYVNVTLDLSSQTSGTTFLVSDMGPVVAIQIIICLLGESGFCSPFIHEEASARLRAQGITTPTALGDRHGGTHVHSPYVYVHLSPEQGPYYKFNVTVPMLVNDPGSFFAIALMQLFLGESSNGTPTIRYDIANALVGNERLLSYQSPAQILKVSVGVRIFSYVCIGMVGSIILYLLMETIKHRNNQVLKLSQGHFLIVFLIAALVATLSSFLLDPKNDTYCRTAYPIILIAIQLLYAITIGRLWRINSVISPLLMQALNQKKPISARALDLIVRIFTCGKLGTEHKASFRKQVSHRQLTAVIAVFTLPQIVLQVLASTLQPREFVVDYNNDESIGRATCDYASRSFMRQFLTYGFLVFVLTVLILLVMAHATRQLPSLFNETKSIFDSALTSIVLLAVGLSIIIVTNDPTVTPSVNYLIWIALVLSITLNFSLRIVLPKLRMVWNGESVLVSKLVSEHCSSIRKKTTASDGINVTGLEPPAVLSSNHASTAHSNSAEVQEDFDKFDQAVEQENKPKKLHSINETEVTEAFAPGSNNGSNTDEHESNELMEPPSHASFVVDETRRTRESIMKIVKQLPESRRNLKHQIIVRQDEAPARRLVLKMIDFQEHLSQVNERIMTGMAVSESDWEKIRLLSGKLGATFQNEVKFSWEGSHDELNEEDEDVV